MGSKLALLAAQLTLVGVAAAQPAPELVKKGIEAYKAGKYDDAARLFEKAYAQEPKAETLFALAQAERLGGRCEKAVVHYKQLLAQTTELATAKAVQNNLALCPQPSQEREREPEPEARPAPAPEPEVSPPPPPRTIVREVRETDALGAGLLATGALGGGFAIGMFLRSTSTRDDAGKARTLDDANQLHDRADRDRLVAIIAGGASAVAIGYAVFRLARGGRSETAATELAVTPTAGGSMMVLSKRW